MSRPLLLILFIACFASNAFASTPKIVSSFDKVRNAESCSVKNLDVDCEMGKNIQLDVSRVNDEFYMTVKTASGGIGNRILVSVDGKTPDVLDLQSTHTNPKAKETLIPKWLLIKLKFASNITFEVDMKKGAPLVGSLGQYHFDWLSQFGKICH